MIAAQPLPAPARLDAESATMLACARLKAAQMRITRPRVAILHVLATYPQPISIDSLHARLKGSACDLVTVYRCLAAFEEIGIVRRTFQFSGTCLFELCLHGRPARYHVSCRECNRIETVDYFQVDTPVAILQQRGFSRLTHIVEFFGLCPACARKPGRPALLA